jgi:hypothetical protein
MVRAGSASAVTVTDRFTTVRVLAGAEEIARHRRSDDTGQIIEEEAHVAGVVAATRHANPFECTRPAASGGRDQPGPANARLLPFRTVAISPRSQPNSKRFIRSAASSRSEGRTCEYVFRVRLICECPRVSMIVRGSTPCASRNVAHECRKS